MNRRTIVSLLSLLAVPLLYGCKSSADSRRQHAATLGQPSVTLSQGRSGATADSAAGSPVTSQPIHIIQEGPQPVSTLVDARPAAMINGKTVTWGELRPALNELAGAQALQDLILDRKINELLTSSGLTVTEDDVAAERKTLLESLSPDPNAAMTLLDDWRDRQNMGKMRFEGFMRRNAGLRALVHQNAKTTDQSSRLKQEQALMDQLSRTILADTSVNIFDESLSDSWARSKRIAER